MAMARFSGQLQADLWVWLSFRIYNLSSFALEFRAQFGCLYNVITCGDLVFGFRE